jgi:hypothetical protein
VEYSAPSPVLIQPWLASVTPAAMPSMASARCLRYRRASDGRRTISIESLQRSAQSRSKRSSLEEYEQHDDDNAY